MRNNTAEYVINSRRNGDLHIPKHEMGLHYPEYLEELVQCRNITKNGLFGQGGRGLFIKSLVVEMEEEYWLIKMARLNDSIEKKSITSTIKFVQHFRMMLVYHGGEERLVSRQGKMYAYERKLMRLNKEFNLPPGPHIFSDSTFKEWSQSV